MTKDHHADCSGISLVNICTPHCLLSMVNVTVCIEANEKAFQASIPGLGQGAIHMKRIWEPCTCNNCHHQGAMPKEHNGDVPGIGLTGIIPCPLLGMVHVIIYIEANDKDMTPG